MAGRILIVDDEPDMLSTCRAALEGHEVVTTERAEAALRSLAEGSFDLVVADIRMPGMDGIALLEAIRVREPELPVLLVTAFPEVDTAVAALRAGALDYLIKPFHPEDLRRRVERALEERRLRLENRLLSRQLRRGYAAPILVGETPAMRRVREMIARVAPTPADVLILGESGTGKELVARQLHELSGRRGHFVPVDCGAIPEQLLENELFGHERGAYTGATTAAAGLLELADGGTFFLDEVAELPLGLQAKLLRTLQERQFRRVGGRELRRVDLRVVAATNKDLAAEGKAGRFRRDLYYRLCVLAIELPPLRERTDDIPLLVEHFLPRICREMGRPLLDVDPVVYEVLAHYPWPGNVRELQNVLKQAVVLARTERIRVEDLPASVVEGPQDREPAAGTFAELKRKRIDSFERDYFARLLHQHRGNAREAAAAAGLPLSNLYWYLKKHGLKPRAFRS